jgi:hypothetical protein
VVDGTFIEEVSWDYGSDYFLHYFLTEVFGGDFLGVLS